MQKLYLIFEEDAEGNLDNVLAMIDVTGADDTTLLGIVIDYKGWAATVVNHVVQNGAVILDAETLDNINVIRNILNFGMDSGIYNMCFPTIKTETDSAFLNAFMGDVEDNGGVFSEAVLKIVPVGVILRAGPTKKVA